MSTNQDGIFLQGASSVAMGRESGYCRQDSVSVAVGVNADNSSVAVGSVLDLLKQVLINQELMMKDINDIKNSNNRLDNHINFIEKVYNDISYPLSFLKIYKPSIKM